MSRPAPPSSDRPPRLGALFVSLFLNTFVGNAWTLLVALLAVRGAVREDAQQKASALTFILGTAPLVIMSVPAALLADRFKKGVLLQGATAVLLACMAGAAVVLMLAPGALPGPLLLLVLVGAQAAVFSPAKYGILPDLVPHDRLSEANGRLELLTFLAIVSGSAAAAPLLAFSGTRPWLAAAVLVVLAAIGLIAARRIPDPSTARRQGSVRETLRGAWAAFRADRVLALAVLGSVGFWGVAKLLGQNMLVDARARLDFAEQYASLPLAILAVGVGVGSALAGRLSARKVETGLLPLGAILLAAFTLLLGITAPGPFGTSVLMVAMGVASGFLLVPLNALLQWRAPEERRGAVIALSNAFVFTGVCAGAGTAALLAKFGLSTRGIFVATGLGVLGGAVWATACAPQACVRLVLFLLTHTFYRLRVVGREHVPVKGGALLVPNHVSFVDGLLVIASLDRPVRFLVDAAFFTRPLVGRALRWFGAIPIGTQGGPRTILRALRDAGRHLDEGHLVCIFPEGQITRNGMLNPFRRGLERIVKGRDVPILPIHLDRVWGSIFSFSHGRFVTKLVERLPYPVQVTFGEPLPATTPLSDIRRRVQELGAQAWSERKADRRPLSHTFVQQARRHPRRALFADGRARPMGRLKVLVASVAMARALRPRIGSDDRVGLLLPPSLGGALANLAVALAGRTSVNLNYTAGAAAIASAARQAGVRVVLTSPEFLVKAKVELPPGVMPIFIDELVKAIPRSERWRAGLLALLAPMRWLEKSCGAPRRVTVDDLATVIFSSGSTGEPKGVMLSHFNIDANVEALAQAFRTTKRDRILGILPLFHSFGYTATLWLPVCQGLATVFHPSPIDAAAVGDLVERHQVTFLLATPTLLSIYLRRCTPAQFGSLRVALAGAEKLPERLVAAFEDWFGIRPLEGYGATECAPVVAASTPDFRAPGFYQPGWRRGFVGQPIPGVAVRVVAPDTFAPLLPDQQGLLLVKGPNVMQGYLGRPDLTEQAFHDGWYVTGDLALIDEDGFIKITDRVSRFSKIGGEMVPHGRIEEELHQAAGLTTQAFIVTALPDPKKGERLAVVHTLLPEQIPELLVRLQQAGLPNLFIPRADQFVHVAALPVLGTGKIDLRAAKQIAADALAPA